MHLFQGFDKGVSALQFLQRANNIGKVVITDDSRLKCRADAMPLLSGGTGALGIVTTQFLVEEGAKSVCLLSRSGKIASDVKSQWDWLTSSLAEVAVEKCDVGQEDSVLSLRSSLKKPLSHLLHLAGVLADGMLPSLSRDSFEKSF
jgi:NAD(P)-dependent dehydrogenase (short-subunit alcohol dehydrogenase family)